jgi:hypothetical protein
MQKQSKIIILASLIAIGILFLSFTQTTLFFPQDYDTGRTVNTTSTKNTITATTGNILVGTTYLTVENRLNHNDLGELLDSTRYITSWQPNQYSVPITAKCDMNFNTRWGYLWCYLRDFPDTMIRDYYWDVTYTDVSGNSIKVIDGKNFIGGAGDPSVKTDYVYIIRGYPRRNFPNVIDTSFAMTDTSGVTGTWYSWANSPAAEESYTLETETLVFAMKGDRVGTLNVKCILADSAYADHDEVPFPCVRIFETTGPVILSEDNAYLPSGRGEVRVESVGAIRSEGREQTEETGIVYTKYVFEEGSTVKFSVDTGYSGAILEPDQQAQGFTGGWVLQIIDSGGNTRWVKDIPDGVKNYPVEYNIPAGSFIPNDPNDNEWMVVLSNTLFDQSESRLFVVDTYQKIPGKTTITVDANQVDQFDFITWTASASPNPEGTNEIHHFRIWAVYGHPTSTDYALTVRNYPATRTDGTYVATDNFQVIKGDKNVYIVAVAVDSEGRAGVEGTNYVYVKQVIPSPDGLPDIPLILSQNIWLVLGIIIVAVVGTILYLYQKKGPISFLRRRKK